MFGLTQQTSNFIKTKKTSTKQGKENNVMLVSRSLINGMEVMMNDEQQEQRIFFYYKF